MPTVLRNLKVDAVAFVDKGAGKGVRITLFKRRGSASEESTLEKNMSLEEVLAELPEEKQAPILAALEAAKASKGEDEEADKMDEEEADKADDSDEEEADKADDKEEDEAAKRLAKRDEENKELRLEIAKLRDAEEKREFIEKAKAFDVPGLATEDAAAILRSVTKGHAVTGRLAKKLEDAFASITAFVRKSKLLEESGRAGAGMAGDAWGEIKKRAEAIAKSEGVTIDKATAQVIRANPDLYEQYTAESRGGH